MNKLLGSSEFDEGWNEDGDVSGTDKMADSYWARRAVASQGGGQSQTSTPHLTPTDLIIGCSNRD